MSIRAQLLIGFSVLTLVFLIDFIVNKRLSANIEKNTTYLNNSEAVIRNSNMLHKNIIEMQSGFRGFLLTGQEVFLSPFYEGLQTVPLIIAQQQALQSTLPQRQRLDSIVTIHLKWVKYANSLISTKLDTLPEANAKYIELFETKLRMEVGKKLNDKIKEIFKTFDNYEYQLRQERKIALQKSVVTTNTITLTVTILSILLALLFGTYFINMITRRISNMVSLAEEISTGDFKEISDHKNDELNRLSFALNKMSMTLKKTFNELTKKNKELDQFAYVVSHDLKTPLRGINNIVLWMEEDLEVEISPEIKKNLNLIISRTARLENMINGLLEYAKVGKVQKGAETVDVLKLVREVIDLIVPKEFTVQIDGVMPFITTEKLHIEQVFSNLIANAVKYNQSEHPKIVIKSRDLNDFYEFTVKDNGIGIQKEYFEKIFVIFHTLQEKDAFESTGVGLAIVKKIIDDYKGTIKVESEVGKGSSFIFTWPKNVKPTKSE
jgi:signal transduction histidine kinase